MPEALQPIQKRASASVATTSTQDRRLFPAAAIATPSNPASSQIHPLLREEPRPNTAAGGKKRPDGGATLAGARVATVTVAVTTVVPFGVTAVGETLQEP